MPSICLSIQNGLVGIEDFVGGVAPEWVDGVQVLATASCVLVRCRHEIDGVTELTLGAAADIVADGEPVFDGTIATPSRELMISDVLGAPLLRAPVDADATRVRVWVNHPVWPDRVTVAWGEGRRR
jgi:hypothetical protein